MGNRKLPFGYQMRFGDVIPYPDEAEAVQKTYQNYLAGASFRQIAEGLQAQGIPYDGDKQWNKNMVARILENERYTGIGPFPALVPAELFRAVQDRRIQTAPERTQTPAQKELQTMLDAVGEIVDLTSRAFLQDDLALARRVEPLEQVIDKLLAEIKDRHIARLTGGSCTIELGFVLAAAGSAVSVGNLWRFPYLAAKDGGGLFLLVYLVLVLTFGFTLLSSDIAIGRRTHKSAIGAYAELHPKWRFLGILTFLVPVLIMTYYAVIGGCIKTPDYVIGEMERNGEHFRRKSVYRVMIRYIAPVMMLILFLQSTGILS